MFPSICVLFYQTPLNFVILKTHELRNYGSSSSWVLRGGGQKYPPPLPSVMLWKCLCQPRVKSVPPNCMLWNFRTYFLTGVVLQHTAWVSCVKWCLSEAQKILGEFGNGVDQEEMHTYPRSDVRYSSGVHCLVLWVSIVSSFYGVLQVFSSVSVKPKARITQKVQSGQYTYLGSPLG